MIVTTPDAEFNHLLNAPPTWFHHSDQTIMVFNGQTELQRFQFNHFKPCKTKPPKLPHRHGISMTCAWSRSDDIIAAAIDDDAPRNDELELVAGPGAGILATGTN